MSSELDAKIADYYALDPLRFPVVKSITFTQGLDPICGAGEMQHHLSLVFANDESFTGDLLFLELFGVRNFVFEQPSLSLFNLYLSIETIGEGGGVDGHFKVFSSEQDVKLVCSCRDFVAAIAAPAPPRNI